MANHRGTPTRRSTMSFDTWQFFLFLPIVLLGSQLLRGRALRVWLLLASWTFYAAWDWRFLGLILGSTVLDYLVGRGLDGGERGRRSARSRRALLVSSLVGNLGLLATFKYLGWFVASAALFLETLGFTPSLPVLEIVLPVGISFYTFQTLGYTIDVYRGQLRAERDPLLYALYVAWFPQLVAGPIERAGDLLPRLARPERLNAARAAEGLFLILMGLFKKVALADAIAPRVDAVWAEPEAFGSAALAEVAVLFAFQIYFDFGGYSDIARGTSRLFGVELMENFRQPFLSARFTELWRRWHVSLSTWFRDYLYVPLGGGRGGRAFVARNLLIVMAVAGLWHGASWTMVIWGLFCGVVLVFERFALGPAARGETLVDRPFHPLQLGGILYTFTVFVIAFVFFRAPDLTSATSFFAGLGSLETGELFPSIARVGFYGTILLGLDLAQARGRHHCAILSWPWPLTSLVLFGMMLFLFAWSRGPDVRFIYFQF